ncbi:MAG: hypothetical protein NTZ05_16970, partial [Chloroflexi bacterium]|nr:hypothetical protein [Chloroflexota bacterium]
APTTETVATIEADRKELDDLKVILGAEIVLKALYQRDILIRQAESTSAAQAIGQANAALAGLDQSIANVCSTYHPHDFCVSRNRAAFASAIENLTAIKDFYLQRNNTLQSEIAQLTTAVTNINGQIAAANQNVIAKQQHISEQAQVLLTLRNGGAPALMTVAGYLQNPTTKAIPLANAQFAVAAIQNAGVGASAAAVLYYPAARPGLFRFTPQSVAA